MMYVLLTVVLSKLPGVPFEATDLHYFAAVVADDEAMLVLVLCVHDWKKCRKYVRVERDLRTLVS